MSNKIKKLTDYQPRPERCKYTQDSFIEAARKVHEYRYDYSKLGYVTLSGKVGIICSEHGLFFQKGQHHLSGAGCKKCGIARRVARQLKPSDSISDREFYYQQVRIETEKSWKMNRQFIDHYNLGRNSDWHLDHEYPKSLGYMNNVDPKIIGHWVNLHVKPASENISKNAKEIIDLEMLYRNYRWAEGKYHGK